MLLCDVTMTLIRQEKIGNIFFLKQHICFLKKMNINHFYPEMHTGLTKRPALITHCGSLQYQYCCILVHYNIILNMSVFSETLAIFIITIKKGFLIHDTGHNELRNSNN